MYTQLLEFIRRHSSAELSDNDVALIQDSFRHKKLRKKQYFLQESEVCRYLGFVLKGAMRQYTVDDKGGEHIMTLSVEEWWVGDRESFFQEKPSVYNIDAWEDTELLLLSRDKVDVVSTIPAFTEMRSRLDQNFSVAAQKRLLGSFTKSAEERYAELRDNHPLLLQRFPQHQIASYLGITKETLSRIRSQGVRKS